MKRISIFISILFINLYNIYGQVDTSYKDVFPLSVGNYWKYDYDYNSWASGNLWNNGFSYKGSVSYSIQDSIGSSDSTIWKVRVNWDITAHIYSYDYYYSSYDTTYSESDSTLSELVESQIGNHQVYFLNNFSHYNVWRLPKSYWDSVMVYRMQQVNDSSYSTLTGHEWSNGAVPYVTKFKKNVGPVSLYIDFTPTSYPRRSSIDCKLKESLITSVKRADKNSELPKQLFITNYPNPFNPSTKITFSLNKGANVKLVVYDVLGKEVERMLEGYKDAGTYEVEFNGSNLSSGVYFYQLQHDGNVKSGKMILLK